MIKLAKRRTIEIGPEDDGREMGLDDFDCAIAQDGHLYELNRGVIEVSEVPGADHFAQVEELREQLYRYKLSHKGLVRYIAGSNEAKILLSALQSERQTDLSLYFSEPPGDEVWSDWIPKVVIEVVSKSSSTRDYKHKPLEYQRFGVSEYWIIDSIKQQMTAMVRTRGLFKPQVVKPPAKYATPLLPGLWLNLKRIFAAAKRK